MRRELRGPDVLVGGRGIGRADEVEQLELPLNRREALPHAVMQLARESSAFADVRVVDRLEEVLRVADRGAAKPLGEGAVQRRRDLAEALQTLSVGGQDAGDEVDDLLEEHDRGREGLTGVDAGGGARDTDLARERELADPLVPDDEPRAQIVDHLHGAGAQLRAGRGRSRAGGCRSAAAGTRRRRRSAPGPRRGGPRAAAPTHSAAPARVHLLRPGLVRDE